MKEDIFPGCMDVEQDACSIGPSTEDSKVKGLTFMVKQKRINLLYQPLETKNKQNTPKDNKPRTTDANTSGAGTFCNTADTHFHSLYNRQSPEQHQGGIQQHLLYS